MKRVLGIFAVMVFVLTFVAGHVFAQTDKEYEAIKGQIEVLTEEIEKIKLGAVAEPEYKTFMGLGPAASKVYGVEKGFSIGGYGETIYQNYRHPSIKDFADAYRFILYGGYKFNDWILMNTELEFEHAGIKNVGGSTSGVTPAVSNSRTSEVYIEFSYLDFLLNPAFNLRTGLLLVPVGFINEYHEPTVYNGVLRPDVEINIIPTTWRDLGIMAYGKIGDVTYNMALMNGLRSDRLSSKDWIRGGRQQGAGVNADVWAMAGRVNYEPLSGLLVGGSYYLGKAGHGRGKDTDPLGSDEKEGTADLWEVLTQYQLKGLHLRGLFASGSLDGNSALESSPPGDVGKKAQGWYIETAYDVLPHVYAASEMSLLPFVRYEDYDTHKEVFTGSPDPRQDRVTVTAGIGFKPHPNVVIKTDYQWRNTASDLPEGKGTGLDEGKIDQFNLGIGFIY